MATRNDSSTFGLPSGMAVRFAAALVFAFAAYAILWRTAPVMEGDSPQYLAVARDLADLRLDTVHDRTPGYPLLLLLTGSEAQPTRLLFFVSLGLHLVSVWLLVVLQHSLGVRKSWSLAFGVLLLLPPYVEPAGRVMTENLAQATLVAGLAALVLGFLHHRRAVLFVLAGLAFGYSGLTRPAYQMLGPVVACCLLALAAAVAPARLGYREAMRSGAAVIAGSLVILGPLALLNERRLGYFGIAPSLGFHLSTKTMSFVERLPDEYAAAREILVKERDAQLTKRGGTHTGTQTIWSARPALAAATGLSTPELSRYLLRMNLTLIRRAPIEYLQEVGRSMSVYWFPAAGGLANMNSSILRWLWALTHLVVVCVFVLQLAVLAGMAAFEGSRRLAGSRAPAIAEPAATPPQTIAYAIAGAIVFYTMVLSCFIDIGEPRQRQSTDALFVFMCFLGAHVWQQTLERAKSSTSHSQLPTPKGESIERVGRKTHR